MKLSTFLDYYQPLDSETKIDKLFTFCFNSKFNSISATDCSKILDVTNEDIKPYFLEKKEELDNRIAQSKKAKKKCEKLKRKARKRSRNSTSVFNKDGIVHKRVHIISTPM